MEIVMVPLTSKSWLSSGRANSHEWRICAILYFINWQSWLKTNEGDTSKKFDSYKFKMWTAEIQVLVWETSECGVNELGPMHSK